ncbi:MAG: sigma 54-interacting transcriptional regulator [Deltaproteobacteria bacterium]|nr:sigma 54-interacting transcriptional regulator [Deltaproteobacteria bacterium]
MKPIGKLLNQKGFLKSLFESIPCGVLIIDGDRRVLAVNNVLERTFGISGAEVMDQRGGEALGCVNAFKNPKGCGFAEECITCGVRNTALEALAGNQIHRKKAKIQLSVDGKTNDLQLLVSAAPFDHEGKRLAVIILENMTELNTLRRRLKTDQSFAGIIGRDVKMQELFDTIREVAEVDVPVLIQGESGTGKELVAAAIHNEGLRANKSFVPVNCGALPEGLLASELFGHVKGSFTGALRDKKGRFELAHGGTLFLDEVVDFPKEMQAKLLRVLQEGTFERVGDEKTKSVDVRIISAANRDLKKEVEKGNFREDLYYRIKVVPIDLPPLRDRKNDIPLLVDHFLKRIVKNSGKDSIDISHESMVLMMNYHWPGNIRELENAIQFAIVKCRGSEILPRDLPIELKDLTGMSHSRGPSKKLDIDSVKSALKQTGGNKAKAARLLGVGRATLYRFLADYPEAMQ